jgi:hypothetical protein
LAVRSRPDPEAQDQKAVKFGDAFKKKPRSPRPKTGRQVFSTSPPGGFDFASFDSPGEFDFASFDSPGEFDFASFDSPGEFDFASFDSFFSPTSPDISRNETVPP